MEFELLDGDDWQGLFVDGMLIAEGHEIPLDSLAEAAGLRFKRIYLEGAAAERLHSEGNFPSQKRYWSELND